MRVECRCVDGDAGLFSFNKIWTHELYIDQLFMYIKLNIQGDLIILNIQVNQNR